MSSSSSSDSSSSELGRPDPPVNNGLMISGGTHYVGNQAIGHRAQAFSGSVGFQPQDAGQAAARTAELLVLVEQLLSEHRAALAEPEATTRELRRLREELDEEEPQPTVLRRALDRLTEFVQPVTPLAVAVGELAQTVRGTLGA